MVKKIKIAFAIALILLAVGIVAADEKLKIIPASETVAKLTVPKENTVSLEEAKARSNNSSTKSETVIDYGTVYPDYVRDGIKGFLKDIANEIYKIVFGNEAIEEISNNFGYGAATVYRIAAAELNPYDLQAVQDMRKHTAYIGLFAFVGSVLLIGIKVNFSAATTGAIDRVIYTVTQTVSTFGQFRDNLLYALFGIICIHYLLKFIVQINSAMTAGVMTSALEYIALDNHNLVVYVIMAFCYLLEAFFYGIRFIMMGIIAGADVLLGGLFAFPSMRNFVIETIKYFAKITFMQFIVVLVTFFGIAIIDELPLVKDLACICLTVIIITISGVIVFGFANLFKAAKLAVRYV